MGYSAMLSLCAAIVVIGIYAAPILHEQTLTCNTAHDELVAAQRALAQREQALDALGTAAVEARDEIKRLNAALTVASAEKAAALNNSAELSQSLRNAVAIVEATAAQLKTVTDRANAAEKELESNAVMSYAVALLCGSLFVFAVTQLFCVLVGISPVASMASIAPEAEPPVPRAETNGICAAFDNGPSATHMKYEFSWLG